MVKDNSMISKKQSSANPKGFTLVEMIVLLAVITILGLISGTALMKWVPQANLKRAARTIVSMAQDAKIEAIKRNRSVRLSCSNSTNSCITQLLTGETLRFFDIGAIKGNIHLVSDGSSTFTSQGRASSETINIQNNAGQQYSIIIRLSGSIITR